MSDKPGLLIVGALIVAGCSGGGSSSGARLLERAAAPFEKNYSHTTCAEYRHQLTSAEREAAATIALSRLRQSDDQPEPSDAEIQSFEAAITGVCQARGGDTSLVSAAVFAYQN